MPRISSLVVLAAAVGVGFMFLKGLHLEDIKQFFVQVSNQQPGNEFPVPGFGTTPTSGTPGPSMPMAPPAASGQSVRLATFNIQVFGNAKENNARAYWELAHIINAFDLVAIQEIRTQDDQFMARFTRKCSEIGRRQWRYHVGPRLGNTRSTEQYAYLWDAAKFEINPNMTYTVEDRYNLLHREPLVAMFRTRGVPAGQEFTFILVNIHTDPDVAVEEMNAMPQLYDLIRNQTARLYGSVEDDIIVLGDLNTNVKMQSPAPLGGNRPITPSAFGALGNVPGIYPVIRDQPTNVVRSKLHDNIMIQRQDTSEFTGRAGVYDIEQRRGLTLDQARQVSDHLPVWAEFSTYESGIPGRVAAGSSPAPR